MITLPETSALIIGKMYGKTNFSYFMSPKKTWEGFFGQFFGVVPTILIIYLFCFIFRQEKGEYTFWTILLTGIGLIAVAIVGDLMESILKRSIEMKDSSESKVFGSGLGGVLDKYDSMGVGWIFMAIFLSIFHTGQNPY